MVNTDAVFAVVVAIVVPEVVVRVAIEVCWASAMRGAILWHVLAN